jgi:hypothetical protein
VRNTNRCRVTCKCLYTTHTAGQGEGRCAECLTSLPALLPFDLCCRDSDSEDRNFSPVMLSGGGVTDLAITAMDQGWCMQAYTCQKRLS